MGRARLNVLRGLTRAGTAVAVAATAHTAYNLRRLRRLPPVKSLVHERVSVLLPVRDEAHRLRPCLLSLLAQTGLDDVEIVVLDDGSTDSTVALVRAVTADDARVRLVVGGTASPPDGWLGKTWACQRLADAATGDVLVFVDADVVLAPEAVAASVQLLRTTGLDLVSPYPCQRADTVAERLVQPLLAWSWVTTVPLGPAERSSRASTAVANGQLLVVDAGTYRRAGGHASVRTDVVDDVALLRAVRRVGGHGTVVDGSALATCRMYDGWGELRDGYAKSLATAFGSPAAGLAVAAGLTVVYVLPAVAALRGSRTGAVGYAAGVVGRALVARRMGSRVLPDVLAHPVSVTVLAGLLVDSVVRRRRGTVYWKGRALP